MTTTTNYHLISRNDTFKERRAGLTHSGNLCEDKGGNRRANSNVHKVFKPSIILCFMDDLNNIKSGRAMHMLSL